MSCVDMHRMLMDAMSRCSWYEPLLIGARRHMHVAPAQAGFVVKAILVAVVIPLLLSGLSAVLAITAACFVSSLSPSIFLFFLIHFIE